MLTCQPLSGLPIIKTTLGPFRTTIYNYYFVTTAIIRSTAMLLAGRSLHWWRLCCCNFSRRNRSSQRCSPILRLAVSQNNLEDLIDSEDGRCVQSEGGGEVGSVLRDEMLPVQELTGDDGDEVARPCTYFTWS